MTFESKMGGEESGSQFEGCITKADMILLELRLSISITKILNQYWAVSTSVFWMEINIRIIYISSS